MKIPPWIFICLLLASTLYPTFHILPVTAQETIYIRADGSIEPSTAPIMRGYYSSPLSYTTDTYILYADVAGSIVVECSRIAVDGQGFTVWGSNSSGSIGVQVAKGEGDSENAQYVEINNMRIEGFEIGIDFASSYDVASQNTIINNRAGVRIRDRAFNNLVMNNTISDNDVGVILSATVSNDSYNVCVYNNNFVGNDKQISTDEYTGDKAYFSFPMDGLNPAGGGNYWSDYNGSDLYSGLLQNQPGGDGLGDTPYNVSSSLEDYYPQMAPVFLKMPSRISISTTSSTTVVGFSVDLNGTLYDIEGNRLAGQTIVLLYTFPGSGEWSSITSDVTDNYGHYHFQWIPTSTGYFTMRAEWSGNATYLATTYPVAMASVAYEQKYVFNVESNSTISDLVFDSQNQTLSFSVSGQNGTKGYVRATIAKSLLPTTSNLRVQVEEMPYDYSITSSDDSWLVEFAYNHSTHQVRIFLPNIATTPIFLGLDWRMWTTILALVLGSGICLIVIRRRKNGVRAE